MAKIRPYQSKFAPTNDTKPEVTQELVALFYMDNPVALGRLAHEDAFLAGLTGKPPVEPRSLWETGALAALLIELGGQE